MPYILLFIHQLFRLFGIIEFYLLDSEIYIECINSLDRLAIIKNKII